jgi:uncharacterized protein YciW
MANKTTVTCEDCNTTLVLPEDPEDLAFTMTDFIDRHNAIQHYSFALAPGDSHETSSLAAD